MLEGLFSPVHLLILAVVVFIVVGPRKLVSKWQRTGDQLRALGGDERVEAKSEPPDASKPTGRRESLAWRVGRFARRKRSGRPR